MVCVYSIVSACGLQCCLEVEDQQGRRAVHHAAEAGANSAVQLLHKEGTSLDTLTGATGQTPLHCAAKVSKCTDVHTDTHSQPPMH